MTGFLWHCATDFLGGRRINPIWCRRIAELSEAPVVRYWPQWADLVAKRHDLPAQPRVLPLGTFPELDFQQIDDDYGTMTAAGLGVYLNLNGVAPYAVGGSTVYTEGVGGCLWWVDPNDGSKGLRFTPERPGCTNPPDPDPAAISDIAARLVRRYPDLTMISFLNEPDDRISSAAIAHQIDLRFSGNWTAAAEWVTEKFLRPFFVGASGANFPIAGGEFATPGFMAASVRRQRDVGALAWDWHATTIHLYAGNDGSFPDATYAQLDKPGGIMPYVHELRDKDGIVIGNNGRIIIGETGRGPKDPPHGWLSLISRLYARGDIEAVCLLTDDLWTPESIRDSDPMKNTYEPSDIYRALQRQMQQMTSRHRGARS